MRTLVLTAALLAVAPMTAVVGCASDSSISTTRTAGGLATPVDVAVPPKQLIVKVKEIVSSPPLNIGVAEEGRGMILTNWQGREGDFHVARHWQERTRYRILIAPDWDEPTGKSQVTVAEESEQRPTANHDWNELPGPARPERAAELLESIRKTVGK